MRYINKDPYFTIARFNSVCPETGKPIKKGDEIAYYPLTKKAFHKDSKAYEQVKLLEFNDSFNMMDANY